MGFLFAPAVSTLGHHFKKHKILAFGIFASGASVGGTVLPIAMRRLFQQVGFPWAVRTRKHHSNVLIIITHGLAVAFLVLFCMICGFMCCSTRLPPRKGGRVLDFRVCTSSTLVSRASHLFYSQFRTTHTHSSCSVHLSSV